MMTSSTLELNVASSVCLRLSSLSFSRSNMFSTIICCDDMLPLLLLLLLLLKNLLLLSLRCAALVTSIIFSPL